MLNFTRFGVISFSEEEQYAAEIFKEEIYKRFGISENKTPDVKIAFVCDKNTENKDSYKIKTDSDCITVTAQGIRGLIYGTGMLLRKTELHNGKIFLTENINGFFSPFMQIRGHQLGYRTTSNSYEAWDENDYYQYIKELMFFGCNIFEHVVCNDKPDTNCLMKYPCQTDFINACNEKIKKLDIDISYWCPHDSREIDESAKEKGSIFEKIQLAHVYFPPGSDPGDFEVSEAFARTRAIASEIKKKHPDIKVFPSAQSPDGFGKWGDDFLEEMKLMPDDIDGIITGPNCAMPLHDLRKGLALKYPVRLYPDITHNVRCEYPVHFERDDWHHALAATLSREAINPRPAEYRKIHRLTRQYIAGSVSYSEGINDDINKCVWSNLDYFPDADIRETLEDYSRLFFPGADTGKAVNGILGLEKNWEGDPAENPHIEATLSFFEEMLNETPSLAENVRFLMCLFRAKCDMLVKMRRVAELDIIKQAVRELKEQNISQAEKILKTPFDEKYTALRNELEDIGRVLFEKAGLQLDVKRYSANGWERGATLDTIDNPVTDRQYLINKLEEAKVLDNAGKTEFINKLLTRNQTKQGEYYFSFAENSFTELGVPQKPYFYMDFQGDRPDVNNGRLPMAMSKVFDHYSFRMQTGGLTKKGYKLMLNIKPRYRQEVTEFTIKINGNTLYCGKQYGGIRDEKKEQTMSAPGFELHVYDIPDEYIINGCIELEISEPKIGIMLSDFWIKPTDTSCCISD